MFFEICISFSNNEIILLEYESLEISFIFLSVNVITYSTNITSSGGPYDQEARMNIIASYMELNLMFNRNGLLEFFAINPGPKYRTKLLYIA